VVDAVEWAGGVDIGGALETSVAFGSIRHGQTVAHETGLRNRERSGMAQRPSGERIARRKACGLVAAALALARFQAAVPVALAARPTVFAPDGALAFQALRHDLVVGERRLSIDRASGDLVVRLDEDVAIGPAGRRSYRLVRHVEEVWRDGWLQALVSDTEENGRLWRVRAERSGGALAGVSNDLRFSVSGYPITSSYWHRDTPTQEALLDVTDGFVKVIRGRLVGEETLPVAGQALPTRHFLIHGELSAHLWYDAEARLVRLRAPLPDGSELLYEIA
jgi:hypothetical protein